MRPPVRGQWRTDLIAGTFWVVVQPACLTDKESAETLSVICRCRVGRLRYSGQGMALHGADHGGGLTGADLDELDPDIPHIRPDDLALALDLALKQQREPGRQI